MELSSTHNSNANQLRKISDAADEVVRGLTSINSLNRDPWLIYILVNSETRQAWSEESVTENYPIIDHFIDFLERRCDALESCKLNIRETKIKNAIVKDIRV